MLRGRFPHTTAIQDQYPPRSTSPRTNPVQLPVLDTPCQSYTLHHIGRYPVLVKMIPTEQALIESPSQQNVQPESSLLRKAWNIMCTCGKLHSVSLGQATGDDDSIQETYMTKTDNGTPARGSAVVRNQLMHSSTRRWTR